MRVGEGRQFGENGIVIFQVFVGCLSVCVGGVSIMRYVLAEGFRGMFWPHCPVHVLMNWEVRFAKASLVQHS